MSITRPLLPPKAGYVEVVNENGEHVYKPTPQMEEQLKREADIRDIQSTMGSLLNTSIPEEAPQAAVELHRAMQLFAVTLEDESTMMEIATVYPEYKIGVAYKLKDVFRYGTNSLGDPQLYQVLEAHTSATEWPPESTPGLYKKIGITEDGIPLWTQPLGATDAYDLGDIVMHNGKRWKSDIVSNVWEPGVYGWTEVITEEPDPDEPEEVIPEFVQPSGVHDAYNKGDQVRYNGKIYESLIDSNTYSPDAYPAGWKLIEN